MNLNRIRVAIRYRALKECLMKEYGYEEKQAVETISDIRSMQPDVLHMFIRWFQTKKLPNKTVNDVRIQDIIEHCGMDPFAAFLAWDWVKVQPSVAKYALTRPYDTLELTEEDEEELAEIARKRGWTVRREETAPEDTGDLADPLADDE